MKEKSFEEFLINKHSKGYVGLDDEMADNCNDWLANLAPDEWMQLAELYACECVSKTLDKMNLIIKEVFNSNK